MSSTLAKFAHLSREPNKAEARALCRKAWHEDGVLCVRIEDVAWGKRQQLEQIGTELYGRRKPRAIDGRGY